MTTQDHYNYADQRHVIISVSEDLHSKEDPSCIYAFTIDGEEVDNHDTIPKALLEFFDGKDGYSFDERRSIYECGSSGASQVIMLAVVSGIAAGITTYVIELLHQWRRSKQTQYLESEVDSIEHFLELIKSSYNPYSDLTVIEQKSDEKEFNTIISDSSGMKFYCKVERNTGFITITREAQTK